MNDKITIIGCGALGSTIKELLINGQEKNKQKNCSEGCPTMEIASWDKFLPAADQEAKQKELVLALENAKYVFFCVNSSQLNSALHDVLPFVNKDATVALFSKGLDASTGLNVSDLMVKAYPNVKYVMISGPMLARELKQSLGGATNIISRNDIANQELKEAFTAGGVKVEVVNAEPSPYSYLGVLKNVYATFLGAVSALEKYHGKNIQGYLFVLILREMGTILKDLCPQIRNDEQLYNTLISQAGVGDLFATGSSTSSTNYSAGREMVLLEAITKRGEGLLSFDNLFAKLKSDKQSLPIIYLLKDCITSPEKAGALITDFMEKN